MFHDRTKVIHIGDRKIGGGNPVLIQSMTNTRTEDVKATIEQIQRLTAAGCEIVRCTVPNLQAAQALSEIKKNITIPLVADIHFNYRLAIAAIEHGADKIRINPGNIGDESRVKKVVEACRKRNIPIRIGVNSGSLEKNILAKYGKPTAEALVESALYHVKLLNKFDFDDIVISIKSSNVPMMIKAYRLCAETTSYPLHLGVTEAGTERMGIIKSAVGTGSLLCDEIGETIRVSLTADPVKEIFAAKDILKAVGKGDGVEIISCPTCGRTQINLIKLAEKVEQATKNIDKNVKIAVMGCVVNGPGEAREADIGVAGGKGTGIIFKKGEIIRRETEDNLLNALLEELEKIGE